MAKLAELRKQAKDMGIAAAVIRGATTAPELERVISDHAKHDGKPRKKGAVKKAVRKAVAKKSTKKVSAPKARAKSNSARKASAPAKSTRATKAKRPSTTRKAKATKKSTNGYVPKGGRNLLDHVDYAQTDGWNAREGSAPDRIIKALKRFRGNRTKVFEFLKPKVWDFVGKVKTNGEKRTKPEALEMLKYRISRTAWDFAMRTGQHEKAGNRVEYGTGGTGEGVWKPAKKTKQTAKKAAPKRGAQKRSAGTTRKPKRQVARKPASRQKPAQRRTRATARKPVKRGRGRPKAGSRR